MRTKFVALMAIVAFVLAGCAGSGVAVNPFSGSYNGTWVAQAGDQGTSTMLVLASGATTGTITDTTKGLTNGTIAGTIDSLGAFSGTYTLPPSAAQNMTGNFTRTQTGMTGSVTLTTQAGPLTTTFTFTNF